MVTRCLLLAGLLTLPAQAADLPDLPPVVVYAPSACAPCNAWAEALRLAGFVVTLEDKSPDSLQRVKRWLNVPSAYEAEHTARVARYFLEGPVPVADVLRLLRIAPGARGLVLGGLPLDAAGAVAPQTLVVGQDGIARLFVAD